MRHGIRECLELAIGDLEFLGALANVFLEALLFDAQLAHGQRTLEHGQGGGELDGLLDVVERAGFHGGDRGFERAVPGHDDRDQRGIDELRGLHEIDAVGARHLQVGQQQVEAALAHCGQSFGRRGEAVCLVTLVFERVAQGAHRGRLVVDDEQGLLMFRLVGDVGVHVGYLYLQSSRR